MNAKRWLAMSGLGVLILGMPTLTEAQAALRVTPVVGATLFLTDPPPRFEVERDGGRDLVVRNGRYRDAVTLGALVGVHFGPQWEVEGLLAWTPSELATGQGSSGGTLDAHAYMYGAHVNYHFPRDLVVAPYVSLGAGGEAWDYGLGEAAIHHHLMVYGGGGLDLRLSEFFGARLDVRDCISRFDPGASGGDRVMHHLMLLGGLTFYVPTK